MDPQVAVLFGGPSRERLVSVASAQYIAPFLPDAHLWFWAPEGPVHRVTHERLAAHAEPFTVDFDAGAPPDWADMEAAAAHAAASGTVLLLAVHGGAGEDGTLQALLERHGVGFTGSDAVSSALAFDKIAAKERVAAHGMRITDHVLLAGSDPDAAARTLATALERLGPLIVKPVRDGSSYRLHRVAVAADIAVACAELAEDPSDVVMAEPLVEGVELTVGVVEQPDGSLYALPCSEVRPAGELFDYRSKYLSDGTMEITPAEIAEADARAAQEAAIVAHRALGCGGCTRTDLFLTPEGLVYLETNTLPGLSRASFIPQQLDVAGIGMEAFLRTLLELAAG